MKCEFCNNDFKSSNSLKTHQETARYCLKIRNKEVEKKHKCNNCNKFFSRKQHLLNHSAICNGGWQTKYKNLEKKYENLEQKYERKISKQEKEYEKKIDKLQDRIQEIATEAIKGNIKRVKYLENKYLKRKERVKYDEKNVIYILTTERLQKDRVFIFGKAVNLTNRLSTYNKTDEHIVVFYKSCGTKENMDVVEKMVFLKLDNYKEIGNRERYILPEDKEISFFKNSIDDCIKFLN